MFAARAGDRVGNRGYGANTYTAVVRLIGDCYVGGGSLRAKRGFFGTGGEWSDACRLEGKRGSGLWARFLDGKEAGES